VENLWVLRGDSKMTEKKTKKKDGREQKLADLNQRVKKYKSEQQRKKKNCSQ